MRRMPHPTLSGSRLHRSLGRSTAGWSGQRPGRQGFSLIEIMIVVAIIGILTAVGYVIAQDVIPQYRTRMAAMDFANDVERCRSLAISSGRECRIQMLLSDSALTDMDSNTGKYSIDLEITSTGGWDTLPVDTITDTTDDNESTGIINLDGTVTDGLKHVAIDDWGTLVGPGSGNDDAVVFDTRGFVSNPSSDFTNGHIEITFVNKVAEAKGVPDHWTVTITRAGLTKLVSSRRPTDDNFTASGVSSSTTYDADGSFGSP